MARYVECDAPGCTNRATADNTRDWWLLTTPVNLMMTQQLDRHFCHVDCLAAWSGSQVGRAPEYVGLDDDG